jgi:protein involved in polysaccharide export with SLBB domain
MLVLIAGLLLASASAVSAQSGRGWDPTGLQLSRAELQDLLARYDETAGSDAYSGTLRNRARMEAALLRQRLEEGDLRVGDRVMLLVEGHENLSDTFNVVAGRKLVLPTLGEVSLEGVLRSELQPHLEAYIGRYINSPIVHARSLIRVEIRGAVGRPGFYMMPSDLLLTDALMLAGGPQTRAELDRTRIERGRDVIWSGDRLREAMIEGKTLDQLSVRAGDNIIVPESRDRISSIRNGLWLLSAVSTVVLLGIRLGVL